MGGIPVFFLTKLNITQTEPMHPKYSIPAIKKESLFRRYIHYFFAGVFVLWIWLLLTKGCDSMQHNYQYNFKTQK